MRVYLDNAANSSLDPQVLEAMLPYMKQHYGNPSSIHSFGREKKAAIEQARKKVAGYFHASPSEIFFTSGGTGANNMAILCSFPDLGIPPAITSPIEHHAELHMLVELEKQGRVKLNFFAIVKVGHDIL